jgi:hypothetical protein
MVFEHKMQRKMFGPSGDEVTGLWGNCITISSIIVYSLAVVIKIIISRQMR